jgi:hypothetical protein
MASPQDYWRKKLSGNEPDEPESSDEYYARPSESDQPFHFPRWHEIPFITKILFAVCLFYLWVIYKAWE